MGRIRTVPGGYVRVAMSTSLKLELGKDQTVYSVSRLSAMPSIAEMVRLRLKRTLVNKNGSTTSKFNEI
jgi:hypothetical protein